MNQEPQLQLQAPAFALREIIILEVSVVETLRRRWGWRNDSAYWRGSVRNCITTLRKIKEARWA